MTTMYSHFLTRLYVKTFTSLFSSTLTQWALINLLQLIAVVVYPKIANYSLLPKLMFVHKFDCRDESSHLSFVAYLGCVFLSWNAPHRTAPHAVTLTSESWLIHTNVVDLQQCTCTFEKIWKAFTRISLRAS